MQYTKLIKYSKKNILSAFKYVSVPAKWIKTARQHILNIYTSNDAYMMAFKFDFG